MDGNNSMEIIYEWDELEDMFKYVITLFPVDGRQDLDTNVSSAHPYQRYDDLRRVLDSRDLVPILNLLHLTDMVGV